VLLKPLVTRAHPSSVSNANPMTDVRVIFYKEKSARTPQLISHMRRVIQTRSCDAESLTAVYCKFLLRMKCLWGDMLCRRNQYFSIQTRAKVEPEIPCVGYAGDGVSIFVFLTRKHPNSRWITVSWWDWHRSRLGHAPFPVLLFCFLCNMLRIWLLFRLCRTRDYT